MSQTETYRALKDLVNTTYDDYDKWGWVMGWLFAFAGALYRRGETVPPEWCYAPGPWDDQDPTEADSFCDHELHLYLENGWTTTADVLRLGRVLWRTHDRLELAGESY